MANINDIQSYLQTMRQPSSLNSLMLARSLKSGSPMIKRQDALNSSLTPNVPTSGYFGDAGLYGGPATLPTNPGPVDPPILTQGGPIGNQGPGPAQPLDLWTHLDPNMGYLNPSIEISGSGPNQWPPNAPPMPNASGTDLYTNRYTGQGGYGGPVSGGGGGTNDSYQSPGTGNFPVPGSGMQGTNGPQGSVYTIDPNTGRPVFNVTGSPAPGFFDSKTGKFVEGVGSTALNAFLPGAGSAARAIFDFFRRQQARHNTGTDLSGNSGPGGGITGGAGGLQAQSGLSSGIQDAINRGDYSTAYGQSPSSAAANMIAQSQSYGGRPNQGGDAGRTSFAPSTGYQGMIDPETGLLQRVHGGYDPAPMMTQGQMSAAPWGVGNTAAANLWGASNQTPAYAAWLARMAPRQGPSLAGDVIHGVAKGG